MPALLAAVQGMASALPVQFLATTHAPLPTDRVPEVHKQRARDTLDQLQLRRGDRARWTRWDWYRRYWNGGKPDLVSLRRDAPLVAAAVEKAQQAGEALPDPSILEPVHQVQRRQRRFGPKTRTTRRNPPVGRLP